MSVYTGEKFEYYKAAYISRITKKTCFTPAPIRIILQVPTGHKWVDESRGELLICSNCFQEIALYRYECEVMRWGICNKFRSDVLPCTKAVMRRALL